MTVDPDRLARTAVEAATGALFVAAGWDDWDAANPDERDEFLDQAEATSAAFLNYILADDAAMERAVAAFDAHGQWVLGMRAAIEAAVTEPE